ncbi:I78 family peptidase inhibitor [Nereida sp. MMG025]|nr:I78 family peptidase inhibitor [Nereida sp. MMG025]
MRPALEGRNARILSLRSIRTMDYLPSRINVDIDNAGNVLGIWCG